MNSTAALESGPEARLHDLGLVLPPVFQTVGTYVNAVRTGLVNSTPDFAQHTRVIDGASDVLLEVFGDAGRHARLAVGVPSLPAGLCLEIDAVVEIDA